MCSIHDNEDGELQNFIEDEKIDKIDDHKCRKCDVNTAAIRLRGKDFYCKDCFLIAVTHKFRATLGKSKIVKSSDIILVGYSGDPRSTTLLHLIKAGMHESVHKRLVFKIKVLFIDEGILDQQNVDKRRQNVQQIHEKVKALGFLCFFLSLSDALDKTSNIEALKSDDYCSNLDKNNKDEYLNAILNKLPSKTSKIDFIKKLKNQLMLVAAKKLNCTKIFVGDDLHSLAVDILSNVSLGRGSQLSSDVGFIDERDPDVMILRPLKDFNTHEVEFYMKINSLKASDTGNWMQLTNSGAYSSIQELTNQFVTDLETRFSGTVSTIYRTGEKMTTSINKNKNESDSCIFCNGLLDSKPLDDGISATDATTFSRMISLQGLKTPVIVNNSHIEDKNVLKCDSFKPRNEKRDRTHCNASVNYCNEDCEKKENSNDGDLTVKNVSNFLCYGCRLIFQCNFDLKTVPEFILEKCKEKMYLDNMKEQIEDFLL
ncbi:cytoplasmic tRNA 2-thiolation protein 2 [Chelonus insularis]|uniref:cytoplasmic tRNA 2-thiolation protein 2 n=1 Tax=Chelonus insularis TaxID=460826 RepID=UPI001589ABB9|nr:cytoplasmic tRNA 2-thiolation protein 2 [Chelonus insularis]